MYFWKNEIQLSLSISVIYYGQAPAAFISKAEYKSFHRGGSDARGYSGGFSAFPKEDIKQLACL